ncbi:MAG: S8 family serine peptidase [Thermoanaerobaculia bacterium]
MRHPLRSGAVALWLSASLCALANPAAAAVWSDKVDPWVLDQTALAPSGESEFLIVLAEQADLSGAAGLSTKLAKGTYVFERLRATAARTQAPLLAALADAGVVHRPFWIANLIWAKGNAGVIAALAVRADVAGIAANPRVASPAAAVGDPFAASSSPESVEWNIALVHAPAVWALGYSGQGAVVAGQDTGYRWDHAALKGKYRGWNGAVADHNFNWHDAIHSGGGSCGANASAPCDDHGHGTHTMGTMVGDDGIGNQVGMAPGARWIGCRNMNVGDGTPATYTECWQWFLAPTDLADQNPNPAQAPDVINNSWGCPLSEGCDTNAINAMQLVVESVRSAGIVPVVSAGNSGSSCSSVDTPAAIYDAALSVGATDASDGIASFSSRGPVSVDGSDRRKPDISAPGDNIRSSTRDGLYQGGWSGTSMAGPHVAGLVALLLSADPLLAGNVDRIEQIIEQSAFHPTTSTQVCGGVAANLFPNNTFGFGRIDALAMIQSYILFRDGFEDSSTDGWSSILP